MEPTLAVRCEGLSKRYKHFHLQDVDLSFEQGSVMGLVGPNGAGKSTILRMIMGLLMPDSGRVEVLGHHMPKEQVAAKYQIGFIAEDMRLYESETIGFHISHGRRNHLFSWLTIPWMWSRFQTTSPSAARERAAGRRTGRGIQGQRDIPG